jgi:hypothetical protein
VGGLLMLYIMAFVYSVIGIYLDQIIPMEFGVSKSWNFLCKKKEKVQTN